MKTKNLLIAAAITGALVGSPIIASASSTSSSKDGAIERMGCNGKAGKGKETCNSKDKQGKSKKKSKDKSACAGKDGCGGKAGKKSS